MQAWTQNWYKVVERFQDTISGQFFGHTHNDHFQVRLDAGSQTMLIDLPQTLVKTHEKNMSACLLAFQVYFQDADPSKKAIHFNFISPSLTTYSYLNPSYRIYTIDGNYPGSTYVKISFPLQKTLFQTALKTETYYADLTEANKPGNQPNYTLEYSLPKDYNMPDLSPASWADLINRMVVDDALFTKFQT